jgi:hypothetical protein
MNTDDELESLDTWHESEVMCPYCKSVQHDSWEFPNEDDDVECGDCQKHFSMVREVEVTYSTYKKPREETGDETT